MPSLYDLSFPVIRKTLLNARQLLDKGAAWATDNGIASSEFVNWRIYEDMLPLWGQVTFLVMLSQKVIINLTGQELSIVEVKETPLEGLYAVIDSTIAELDGITGVEGFTAKESTVISCAMGSESFPLSATDFVIWYATPHNFFHLTTLYNILRMKGVPLGKKDYIVTYIDDVRQDKVRS